MESEHRMEPTNSLKTPPPGTNDKDNLSIISKRSGSLSSSSSTISSASDSSDDPFKESPKLPIKSTAGTTDGAGISGLNQNSLLDSNPGKTDAHPNFSTRHEFLDDSLPESTLPSPLLGNSPDLNPSPIQSPSVQTMERPGDASPYRIPSSVFARTKSTAPLEWSTASNESLFSIYMGNMSFSADQHILMGRSGELGIFKSGELLKPGELKSGEVSKPVEHTTSSQFMNYTNNQPPVYQAADIGRRNGNLSQGVGATVTSAFETMKEVLRENEAGQIEAKSAPVNAVTVHTSSLSHHSDASGNSIKSFAFPILTGDGDKGNSVKTVSDKSSHHHDQQIPPPQSHSQPQTPAAKPAASGFQITSWFSCFSCCPFCK